MSTAQREVRVLEGRLAAAKEKAAKESQSDGLAARLATTQQAVNDGERKLNLLNRRSQEISEVIECASKNSRNAEVGVDSRETEARRVLALQNEQEKIAAELGECRSQIDAARGTLAKIRSEIAAHPVYARAVKELFEIRKRAISIARLVWGDAIVNAASLQLQIEALSRDEQAAIGRWGPELESAGLPKLAPRIHGYLGRLIPSVFLSLDLPRLRADCETAAAHVLRED